MSARQAAVGFMLYMVGATVLLYSGWYADLAYIPWGLGGVLAAFLGGLIMGDS